MLHRKVGEGRRELLQCDLGHKAIVEIRERAVLKRELPAFRFLSANAPAERQDRRQRA